MAERKSRGLRSEPAKRQRQQPTEEFTRSALEHFTAIAAATHTLGKDGTGALALLVEHYEALAREAAKVDASALQSLGRASAEMLRRLSLVEKPGTRWHRLLEESSAILPQLIEALNGQSDGVRGLDHLLAQLDSEARTLADDGIDDEAFAPSLADPALREVFLKECETHLDTLSTELDAAQSDAGHGLPNSELLRALHTLNGSAQTVDAKAVVAVVQPLQRVALHLQRAGDRFDADDLQLLNRVRSALRQQLDLWRQGEEVSSPLASLQATLELWLQSRLQPRAAQSLISPEARKARELDAIFREEAEELLGRLERAQVRIADGDSDGIAAALSVLHTLKGSARMCGCNALADRVHTLEAELQEGESSAVARKLMREHLPLIQHEVLALSDEHPLFAARRAGAMGAATDPQSPATQTSAVEVVASPTVEPAPSSVNALEHPGVARAARQAAQHRQDRAERLLGLGSALVSAEVRLGERLERLAESAREMELAARRLHEWASHSRAFTTPAARELLHDIEIAQRGMQRAAQRAAREHGTAHRHALSLQQGLMEARLTRIADAAERFERIVDDAARQCDRSVRFSVRGGDIRLDQSLWLKLQPMLEHLLRNAVVHGLESREQRMAAGKPAVGEVVLDVALDGPEVLLQLIDDGVGLDLTEINQSRREAGLAPLASMNALLAELCRSGYSSRAQADTLSGHGLGLAAVASGLEALAGHLSLRSVAGEGSAFLMRVPLQRVVQQVLLLESDALPLGLPVQQVIELLDEGEAPETNEANESVEYDGHGYRRIALQSLPGFEEYPAAGQQGRLCLLQVGRERLALQNVEPGACRDVLVQPIGPRLRGSGQYLGGGVLADGRPVLILDMPSLLRRRRSWTAPVRVPNTLGAEAPLRILLADDSITMRTAAQRLLESHGFVVRVVRDGAEALQAWEAERPDALLLDIEMPRLDGLQVLAALQQKSPGHGVPVILVSTRQDDEAEALARQHGVDGFVRKPWSEQTLLDTLEAVGIVAATD